MAINNTTMRFLIQNAAVHNGIPEWVLWGIYGQESSFGQNVTTSSAGATGPFQFIPSTARQYGYPQTNNPSGPQLEQQTNAAASYLSTLFKHAKAQGLSDTDAWQSAIESYSGGGYGLKQVQNQAKQANAHGAGHFNLTDLGGAIVDTATAPVKAIGAVVDAPLKFFDLLTNPQTWLRLAEMILGGALLLMGLRSMTGATAK